MKKLLKKILPKQLFLMYHYFLAVIADLYFGFPSKKMIVIGVTGTKGKTSAINYIWACLQASGHKTGIITTANIRIGDQEFLNKYHMTMPGRFVIQRKMAEMVRAGCKFCVVETTSEGLKQFRHIGIRYDIGVFTNLTPEHLPSHDGSFEKYKQTKARMFKALSAHEKTIDGKRVAKVIIANADSEHAEFFLNHNADVKITFGIMGPADVVATNVTETNSGVTFNISSSKLELGILGKFNVYNALPGILIANMFGASDEQIAHGLIDLKIIPGRMEKIIECQNFTVLVDYAHEKQSITNVLSTANHMKPADAKTVIVLGAEGGGRDTAKRAIMGELSAKMADAVVVTNVDPYDDDPQKILEDIATVAEKFGKVRGRDLFVIEDRRDGIRQALKIAKTGDIVLITGKGAEQSMIVGAQKIPWDDRTVVREELRKL